MFGDIFTNGRSWHWQCYQYKSYCFKSSLIKRKHGKVVLVAIVVEVEEVEVEEVEVEEEEVEEEEEGVYEVTIKGKQYYVMNEVDSIIYLADENGDVSIEAGIYKNGKPTFCVR